MTDDLVKSRELTGPDHRGMGWIEDANGRDICAYGADEFWLEQNREIGRRIVAGWNGNGELIEALRTLYAAADASDCDSACFATVRALLAKHAKASTKD